MNKNRIISGAILLAAAVAAVVAWHWIEQARQPSAVLTPTTAKVIAPAHQIPPDVSANMQAALAAREKKLQELAKGK